MVSLELMVKSMLDLRQPETFGPKKKPNCSPRDRERRSTISLHEPAVRSGLDLQERVKGV